ncbi:nicotinamide-nucleotide adenylyltransferase, NadR type [Andreprevotia lacus DSM 23236]|jgi:NadR type nicotinamide-nucleotide adenylyltransferase|uniref:Nicotinamide-nucleotide adenylyltransferase, NadR type n=1 Tax=Andreprevotia lacus DSM 23236 TaxID=1121001 RepID=A0A1W1X6Z6_9NEIS|nr:AAA family ATPase [Andreprevotia lacus]SMC19630.1 nicotinamide-nucleotide adenylyltransferase, NadR type [Andreprevotia lacus DSM 23236]
MKPYRHGLVVGKFAPLHFGHEALLHAAQAQCERLFVISYSSPELPGCEPERRRRWLALRVPAAEVLIVTPQRIACWQAAGKPVPDLPPNDAPDDEQRHFVASLCLHVLETTIDAVFTGEDYGDGFAAVLAERFSAALARPHPVTHVRLNRTAQPGNPSGTLLRGDIHAHRQLLAPEVYADFVERICLLGGESSGKSTLSVALAGALGTGYVAEYGRERWEQQAGELRYDDLLAIAQEQVRREEQAARQATRYLVCDTSPLTTLFYCLYYFKQAEPALHALATRHYHHTVLCAPDFPFVQDGTRQTAAFRQLQHDWYLQQLAGQPWLLASGAVPDRISAICSALQAGLR